MPTDVLRYQLLFALVAIGGTGLLAAWQCARQRRSGSLACTAAVVVYVVVYPISGVVHLLDLGGTHRGHWDVLESSSSAALSAVVVTGLGLVALCLSMLYGSVAATAAGPTAALRFGGIRSRDRRILLLGAVVLAPVAYTGTRVIRAAASSAPADRYIDVDEGYARYAFLAQWGVWCVTFLAIWFLTSRPNTTRKLVVVTAASLIIIVQLLSWTGGRSILLVMSIPLTAFVLRPLLERRLLLVAGALTVALCYMLTIGASRTSGFSTDQGRYDIASLVDWQFGRFSMVGYATERADSEGLLWGETIWSGAANVPLAVLRPLGVDGIDARTAPSIATADITQREGSHIVPGFSAELLMNFGVVGVIVGYLLLGWTIRTSATMWSLSATLPGKIFWSYVSGLLVLQTFNSQAGALPSYVFLVGAPLMAANLIARFADRASERGSLVLENQMPIIPTDLSEGQSAASLRNRH